MANLSIVVVAILVVFSQAELVKFQDCGSVTGKINTVDVSPCTDQPCSLKKGTTPKVTINFTPLGSPKTMKSVVHGVISGIPVPFSLPNPDVCKDSGVKCPVTAGTAYTYGSSVTVKDIYPSIALAIKWEIVDDQGKDVICFVIPAQIVS